MSVLGRGYICWQICQLDVSSNVQLPFWTTRCQYCGGPSAKVGSSAKFGVAVLKASIFNSLGGPSAKVGLSANFGVLVFKASFLIWLGGFIGQSRFMCQVWCSSIQGIYSQFTLGSTSKSSFVCQFWCTGIQGISALFPRGVHLPRSTLTTILHITPGKYEPS